MPNESLRTSWKVAAEPRKGLRARLSAVSTEWRRRVARHPWMTFAGVLSVVAPLVIALLPDDSRRRAEAEAALDELPVPATIEIHPSEATPILAEHGAPDFPDAAAPRRLDAGWNETPAWPAAPATRHAEYRDDMDSSGRVQTVGSNRPATARPRGAWLTGTIEDSSESRPHASAVRPR